MPDEWSAVTTSVVLPIDEARALFARAALFALERGGRFDPRGATVLLWSGRAARGGGGAPVGAFWVRWRFPTAGEATIYRLEWDPAAGGSEREVWTALEVLAGRPLHAP